MRGLISSFPFNHWRIFIMKKHKNKELGIVLIITVAVILVLLIILIGIFTGQLPQISRGLI